VVTQSAEVQNTEARGRSAAELLSAHSRVISFTGRELLTCRLLDNTLVHRRILQRRASKMTLNADNKILRSAVESGSSASANNIPTHVPVQG
jgi:hypothetical protein